MLKTALCIQMLKILFSRDVVSIKELADELETNPRNIPEYRNEQEAAGYVIEAVRGRYGGYRLKKGSILPAVRLTEDEKKSMVEALDYLSQCATFSSVSAYKSAMGKIIMS